MTFNQTSALNDNYILKNSDQSGRVPLACYSGNISKKGKCIMYAQFHTPQRHHTAQGYEGMTLKNMHTDDLYQLPKISNKKQSP